MAVAFILDFDATTAAQYDAVVVDMQLGGRTAPGGLYHGAGATPAGWRVVDVWDSDEAFREFARTKIGPITAAHGMPEPVVQRVEVAQLRRGPDPDARAHFAQVVTIDGIDATAFGELDDTAVTGGALPDGCIFHVNGPVDGGWRVVDYWSSREKRDAFVENVIAPVSQARGMAMPAIEDLDLHATLIAPGAPVNA